MELNNRMTQILYVPGTGLITGDLHGRVHLFGEDLRLLRSSPVLSEAAPLCVTDAADGMVVGKDRDGNLSSWSLATLDLLCRVDGRALCAEPDREHREHPIAGQGLCLWDGHVFTSNADGSLVVLDPATLAVEQVVPRFLGGRVVDCFCTDHPEVHAVVDQDGQLYFGSLQTLEFHPVDTADAYGDAGRVRTVRYDRRHDRFQALEADCADRGTGIANGVLLLGLDGEIRQRSLFSRDEIHLLELASEAGLGYTAGREGVLYVLDSGYESTSLVKTITGFPHEITGLAINEQGGVYVLMLSNELVKLDTFGEFVDGFAAARRQGVWDVQADLERPSRLYCATDEGVAIIDIGHATVGGPVARPIAHHRTRFGMTQRLVAMPDGYVGLTHDETVFRSASDGKLLWNTGIADRGFGLAVSAGYTRLLIASGIGGLELETETGEQTAYLSVDGVPLCAAAYGPAGERILGNREGVVCAFAAGAEEELWRVALGSIVHRLWREDRFLYAAGAAGLTEIDLDKPEATPRIFSGPGMTGCEAAVVVDGAVYLAAHDGRLLGYDYTTGRYRGDFTALPDLARTLAVLSGPAGERYLLAGGRGGYLSVYAMPAAGRLQRLRETRLSRPGGRAFRLETTVETELTGHQLPDDRRRRSRTSM